MVTIISAFVVLLSFRVRSRTSLELELIALRHQLIVLRRQHPRRVLEGITDTQAAGIHEFCTTNRYRAHASGPQFADRLIRNLVTQIG